MVAGRRCPSEDNRHSSRDPFDSDNSCRMAFVLEASVAGTTVECRRLIAKDNNSWVLVEANGH